MYQTILLSSPKAIPFSHYEWHSVCSDLRKQCAPGSLDPTLALEDEAESVKSVMLIPHPLPEIVVQVGLWHLLVKRAWGELIRDFSEWFFSMTGKKKGIKEEPSFLFRFSCQETWCLELWQPFCDHEIKIKRITEKLTQNPQPTHQLCCWVNKTQNHYSRFRLCKQ